MKNHTKFAKLFETDQFGQILVLLHRDTEKDSPEIQCTFQPPGLCPCSIGFGYEDTDDGWKNATAWFEKIDESLAKRLIENAYKQGAALAPSEDQ